MTDTIIMGTGNSREVRTVPNALTLYPNYEAMMQAMIDGSFPLDLLGPNPLGCEAVGTPLNKANLLSDVTETAIWGSAANRTVDEALSKLRSLISTAQSAAEAAQGSVSSRAQVSAGSYQGTGTGETSKTLAFSFAPKILLMMVNHLPGVWLSGNSMIAFANFTLNVTASGNSLVLKPMGYGGLNVSGTTYQYAAIC